MEEKRYEAICVREIYWKEKTRKAGDKIQVNEKDMNILFQAGVIGAIKKIEPSIEQAIRQPPENEMKQYGRKARP